MDTAIIAILLAVATVIAVIAVANAVLELRSSKEQEEKVVSSR